MKRAYTTMMCGGDAYLAGIEALGRSLVDTETTVPRVVMHTPDVSLAARQRLESQGWVLRPIAPIPAPANNELLFKRFALSFTKLRVFDLVEFDKVVFLDADTIVLSNIDELFERPSLSAAPDFFMPNRFNSGLMVLDPSTQLFHELLDSLGRAPAYDGGDQGLLNSHWPDWWASPVEHRLGPGYNLHHFVYQFMSAHKGLLESFGDEVKVIHYTLQKPWQHFNVSGGSSIWWQKFYGANPDDASEWKRRLHSFQDGLFDSLVNKLGG